MTTSALKPETAIELIAMPPSLVPPDSGFMAEWAGGDLAFAGASIALDDGSPFAALDAPVAWREALYGFGWLRHVSIGADAARQARVATLIADWTQSGASRSALAEATRPRRVISWLTHADTLLQTPDASTYDAILAALAAEVRWLERHWRDLSGPNNRLLALIAMAQAGVCIADGEPLRRIAETHLEAALTLDLLPPSKASAASLCDPDSLTQLMLDLEALRLIYKLRLLPVPSALPKALAALGQRVAGLMLGNGTLARLGHARGSREAPLLLAAVRRHIGLPTAGPCHDLAAGFARLHQGETCVIADLGAPLGAGCALSLELSSGIAPLLIDDGLGAATAAQRRGAVIVSGATAGHAVSGRTTTIPQRLQATHSVTVQIDDASMQRLDATHAGHARDGFAHRRQVSLSGNGQQLTGIDELRPLVGNAGPKSCTFAVRFVLHPSVLVTLGSPPDQVELTLANGHRWLFAAPGQLVSVEGAVMQNGGQLQPTLQVLIAPENAASRSVTWQLTRHDDTPPQDTAATE